jgi:hypothetical protein
MLRSVFLFLVTCIVLVIAIVLSVLLMLHSMLCSRMAKLFPRARRCKALESSPRSTSNAESETCKMDGFLLTNEARDLIISARIQTAYSRERDEFYRRTSQWDLSAYHSSIMNTHSDIAEFVILDSMAEHDSDNAKEILNHPSQLYGKEMILAEAIRKWVKDYMKGKVDMFTELDDLEEEIAICFMEQGERE